MSGGLEGVNKGISPDPSVEEGGSTQAIPKKLNNINGKVN